MPYTGPEPARRPLSSDDITDGIVSTADLADSAVTAAKVSSDVSQLGKNLITNGAMTVAQRGTSANIGASPVFTLDRWRWAQSSGTNGTMEQWSTAPTGFGSSLRINPSNAQTPGAAEYNIVGQRIEAQNLQHLLYGTASAKDLTLQFRVRSPKTGTHTFAAYQNDKAGGRLYVGTYTVAVADTWELITHTIPGDASGQIDNDTGNGFDIVWNVGSGSNYETGTVNAWQTSASFLYSTSGAANCLDDAAKDFAIAGVQLEVGSVATDFEHEDYGTTLAKCQRYLEIAGGEADAFLAVAQCRTTTAADAVFRFQVKKRAAPTATVTNAASFIVQQAGGGGTSVTALSASIIDPYGCRFDITVAANLVAGNATLLRTNSAAQKITFSAEL